MEFLAEREARERAERKAARQAVAHAHFTIDGEPLCEFSALAYRSRLDAAGSPPCGDTLAKQSRRAAKLAAQFPGRVALVCAPCPCAEDHTPNRREER